VICRKTICSEDWSSGTSDISSTDCNSDPAISLVVTRRSNMFYSSMARRFLFVLLTGGGLIVGAISFRVSSADLTAEAAFVFGGQAGTDCPGCGFENADGYEECQGSDPCKCTTEVYPIFTRELPPPACAPESRDTYGILFTKISEENFDANKKPVSEEMPCNKTFVCKMGVVKENRRCWTLFGDPCWTWNPLNRCSPCARFGEGEDVSKTNAWCESCSTTVPGGIAMARY